MRYEGKHNYFKDMAHRVKCFKNIPKTMADRHQGMLCYHLNSGGHFAKNIMTGPGVAINVLLIIKFTLIYTASTVEISSLPYKEQVLGKLPNCTEESIITRYACTTMSI